MRHIQTRAVVVGLLILVGACTNSDVRVTAPEATDLSTQLEGTTAPSAVTEISTTTEATTTELATTTTEPFPDGLRPLVDGHNRIDEQRINLIFVRHNFPDDFDWVTYARQLLTWDGPVIVGPLGPVEDPKDGFDLTYGPFSIEPFRSTRDAFNVWYYDEPTPEPATWGTLGEQFPVDIDNSLIIALAWQWPYSASAGVPDFVPPELPAAGVDVFDGVILPVWGSEADATDATLAHELSHAVFGLADKYVFDQKGPDDRTNFTFYPACAADRDEAEEFFGDQVGEVPAAFEQYLAERRASGIDFGEWAIPEEELRQMITVDYVPDGCFGPEGAGRRSTLGGLMYNEYELPVLGAVNLRWAERVLEAWLA